MSRNHPITKQDVVSWIRQVEDRDDVPEVWKMFKELGPDDGEIVSVLVERMRDPNSSFRWLVPDLLGQIGAASGQALPELVEMIRSDDEWNRCLAIIAIRKIGLISPEVNEALRAIVPNGSDRDRVLAAGALLSLHPHESKYLDILRQARKCQNANVRYYAALIAAELIICIPEAASVAILFLDDRDYENAEYTASALAKYDPRLVIPFLIRPLQQQISDARFGLLSAIHEFGTRANVLSAELVEAMLESNIFDDISLNVRRIAANVAQSVPLIYPEVIKKLRFMLSDPSDWVAEQAAKALLSFGEIPNDARREAEDALAFIESPPERRGFPLSISEAELESLSAQDLMPDPGSQLRRIRKMSDRE